MIIIKVNIIIIENNNIIVLNLIILDHLEDDLKEFTGFKKYQ